MSDLLNKASLVMVPSGYKEDTVYSVVPTDGSGDLSFTRASNGTRINSAGLIEVCPWNLVEYSEQFDNGAWTAVNCSIVANDAIAPNGTTTADKFTTTSTTTECEVRASNFSILSNVGIPFTTSVYAKKGTANFLRIRNLFSTVTVIERNGWFNLNTGTLGTIDAGQTGTITDVGNGWYRCTLTGLVGSGGNANLLDIGFTNADNTSFPTTSVYGYLWGAQLNIGSTAKPYFPTTDRLNVPRLTYQNGGGGCPSLLLEKQSTNLLQYSEDFTNAVYGAVDVTITANNTTSPDGTQNADKMTIGTATSEHVVYNSLYTTILGQYSTSVYLKKGNSDYALIGDNGANGSNYAYMVINLNNGAITQTGYSGSYTLNAYNVESVGNGWYRCSITYTVTSDEIRGLRVRFSNSATPTVGIYGTVTYTGNGTDFMYIWGAQLEASSYATSYIPTTSSSATRVADACFKTGISSLIGTNQGSIYVNFDANAINNAVGNYIFDLSDGSNFDSNRIAVYWTSDTTLSLFYGYGGTFTSQSYTYNFATTKKIAVRWTSTQIQIIINGVAQTAVTYGNSSPTKLSLASRFNDTELLSCGIKECVLFNTTQSTADLIALTTI